MAYNVLQLRRGTAAEWASANPILSLGEMVLETDTEKLKLGDGTTAWTSLGYFAPALGNDSVTNAILANMPTKTYKGRTVAGAGDPEDVAVATLKTDLALVKGDVGLGNADNTTDAAKPISTATQTALDGKQPLDSDLTTIAGLTATTDNFMVAAASAWASRTPAQAKTALALVKGDVGLGNVDNTSDANKPVSTAQQTALDAKLDDTQFSGLAKITVGTVAPVGPATGDLWVDTN